MDYRWIRGHFRFALGAAAAVAAAVGIIMRAVVVF